MTATGCSGSYKEGHSLEVRKAESARIMKKYVDRFPVIVEKAQRSDVPTVDKCKSCDVYPLQGEER
ncbi:Autophagy-related protein 8f [Apostasia shenzhenica]|uniref:Autophagy-related protein n=1 Tax=Apostasia shenzhenica TaxID=1088818 RepID=A0A2I0AYQ2_9ASPA|nr:Autophagy-related protein 8f [Apostasia shenzhenica]